MDGHLMAKPFHQQLTNRLLVRTVRVQRVRGKDVTVPKRRTRQPLGLRLVDDPVSYALVLASSPLHDHVSAVDDVHIFI